ARNRAHGVGGTAKLLLYRADLLFDPRQLGRTRPLRGHDRLIRVVRLSGRLDLWRQGLLGLWHRSGLRLRLWRLRGRKGRALLGLVPDSCQTQLAKGFDLTLRFDEEAAERERMVHPPQI